MKKKEKKKLKKKSRYAVEILLISLIIMQGNDHHMTGTIFSPGFHIHKICGGEIAGGGRLYLSLYFSCAFAFS